MDDESTWLGQGTVIKATDRALLIRIVTRDEPIWVPKSQIHDDSEVYAEGHEGDVYVTSWWAAKEGLD